MPSSPQSFANHARYNPLFHFVVTPLLLINLVLTVREAILHPGWWTAWGAVVAFAIWLGIALGRSQALTVQNRIIRLEETLRLQRLLPAEAHGEIAALTWRELVALRFASDEEVPGLFRRTRNGEFARPRDIKRAVTGWRPDTLRV